MRAHSILWVPVSLLAVAAMSACSKTEQAPEQAQPAVAGPRTVHVTATDYAFQAPDTLTGGLTAFHLMNNGKELHHLMVVRLPEGMTMADLQKLNPEGPMPAGMVMVGGPNPANPEGTAEAVVDLRAGNYVMLCMIPSPDGKLHMAKGMVRGLTVIAGETASQPPTPDVTIKLSDYAFEPSVALAAGHHIVKVENAGPQPHEFVIVKLDAGKTAQQFLQWTEKMQGPPPGTALGGVSPISMGESNYVTLDLTPGEYGLFCFVSDTKDGKPHFMHGMMKQITVL